MNFIRVRLWAKFYIGYAIVCVMPQYRIQPIYKTAMFVIWLILTLLLLTFASGQCQCMSTERNTKTFFRMPFLSELLRQAKISSEICLFMTWTSVYLFAIIAVHYAILLTSFQYESMFVQLAAFCSVLGWTLVIQFDHKINDANAQYIPTFHLFGVILFVFGFGLLSWMLVHTSRQPYAAQIQICNASSEVLFLLFATVFIISFLVEVLILNLSTEHNFFSILVEFLLVFTVLAQILLSIISVS